MMRQPPRMAAVGSASKVAKRSAMMSNCATTRSRLSGRVLRAQREKKRYAEARTGRSPSRTGFAPAGRRSEFHGLIVRSFLTNRAWSQHTTTASTLHYACTRK
jgi:hypothetical protein